MENDEFSPADGMDWSGVVPVGERGGLLLRVRDQRDLQQTGLGTHPAAPRGAP